jgi:thioredoxin reductase (NADPH)
MMQEQAAAAGAEFQMSELQSIAAVDGGWLMTTSAGEVQAKAVIVATGSSNRMLGVPGEERLTGKGVSHCASCDGPLLKNKKVIVVGAGDSGLQEALTLAQFAAGVLVLHPSAEPRAQETYQKRLREQANIKLQGNTAIEEILGEHVVTGVRVRDKDGLHEIAADAVFVYIGMRPNTEFLLGIVDLDHTSRVRTDIQMCTSAAGIFAAGDVRADSASQAITAAGDGATAAMAVDRYLTGLASP